MIWEPREMAVVRAAYDAVGPASKTSEVVVGMAEKMSRTPASISIRLENYVPHDPVMQARGRQGFSGGSESEFKRIGEYFNMPDIQPFLFRSLVSSAIDAFGLRNHAGIMRAVSLDPASQPPFFQDEHWTLLCCPTERISNEDIVPVFGRPSLAVTSPPYNLGQRGKITGKDFGGMDYDDDVPEHIYQQQQSRIMSAVWRLVGQNNGVFVYNHKPRMKARACIDPSAWFPSDIVRRQPDITWNRGSTWNHTWPYTYDDTETLYIFGGKDSYFQNCPAAWEGDPNNAQSSAGVGRCWTIKPDGPTGTTPLALIRQVVRMWSRPGDLVFDPYSGLGTTAIAARIEGRRVVSVELSQKRCEESVARYLRFFGQGKT